MSRSTAHRYVTTLVALGYLEQTDNRKYRLGLKVADLGTRVLNVGGVRGVAWPEMQGLRDSSGGMVTLFVLDGVDVICVASARSHRSGQYRIDPEYRVRSGSRLPASSTASGKVLLAALDSRARRQIVAQMNLRRPGHRALTNKRDLNAELDRIAMGDVAAVGDEELACEALAVAAPITRPGGQVAAALEVATYGLGLSRAEHVERFSAVLLETAGAISQRLAAYTRGAE
jgi:IclR family pca regulon transcriptional regulator